MRHPGAVRRSLFDTRQDIRKRRGLETKDHDVEKFLLKEVASMQAPRLRGLLVELVAWNGAIVTHSVGDGFGESMKELAAAYGVDVAKLKREAVAEEKAAKKAKASKKAARAKVTKKRAARAEARAA